MSLMLHLSTCSRITWILIEGIWAFKATAFQPINEQVKVSTSKGDVRRTTKSADFICRQNRPILLAKIEHVLSSTILSADFLYRTTNFVYVAMVIVYNKR